VIEWNDAIRCQIEQVTSQCEQSLAEVVDAVRRMTGSISEVKWGAMPPRRWDTCCWVADIAKIAARFGWRPRVGLDDGIRRLAAWLETAGSEYELCNAG